MWCKFGHVTPQHLGSPKPWCSTVRVGRSQASLPLSSEVAACTTVKARFWPWPESERKKRASERGINNALSRKVLTSISPRSGGVRQAPRVLRGECHRLVDRYPTPHNVQWFRGGLVFKARPLLYCLTLGLRVIKQEKKLPDTLPGGRWHLATTPLFEAHRLFYNSG